MKKEKSYNKFQTLVLIIIFISIHVVAYSQNDPAWLLEEWRTEQYPSNVYIKGFAQDNKNSNETIAEVTERVRNMARSTLSESILSSIQSVNESYSQSVMQDDKESVSETFKSDIKVYKDILDVLTRDTLQKTYSNAFDAIGSFAEGEQKDALCNALRTLTKADPTNVKESRRSIADKLNDDGLYKF